MSLQSSSTDRIESIVTDLFKYCKNKKTFDKSTSSEKQQVYELIDGFCEIMRSRLKTKYNGSWSNFCKDFKHVCKSKTTTCTKLPGQTNEKRFIAHITHTLQDWGLFQDYLNISQSRRNNIFRKIKDPPKRKSSDYLQYMIRESITLTSFLESKFNNDKDAIANEVSKIILRKDNVVFLRKFDTDCCKITGESAPSSGIRKSRNSIHDDFIDDLEHVINGLVSHYKVPVFEEPVRRREKRKQEKSSTTSSTRRTKTALKKTSAVRKRNPYSKK